MDYRRTFSDSLEELDGEYMEDFERKEERYENDQMD